jgi:integrase
LCRCSFRSIPPNPDLPHRLELLPNGWAFPGQDHGHVSANHVGVIPKRLLGEGHTSHTLRHMFASKAYADTRDLRAVRTLLGHSKPETTAGVGGRPVLDIKAWDDLGGRALGRHSHRSGPA